MPLLGTGDRRDVFWYLFHKTRLAHHDWTLQRKGNFSSVPAFPSPVSGFHFCWMSTRRPSGKRIVTDKAGRQFPTSATTPSRNSYLYHPVITIHAPPSNQKSNRPSMSPERGLSRLFGTAQINSSTPATTFSLTRSLKSSSMFRVIELLSSRRAVIPTVSTTTILLRSKQHLNPARLG